MSDKMKERLFYLVAALLVLAAESWLDHRAGSGAEELLQAVEHQLIELATE